MEVLDRSGPECPTSVDLLVFTCEGREHLLSRTIGSFEARCPFKFHKRILAIDGLYAPAAKAAASADVVVQLPQRRGYIANIHQALQCVESPFFFWLEDDWSFLSGVDLGRHVEILSARPQWMQVRLSKYFPLREEEQAAPLGGEYYRSLSTFSANPSLNRTEMVRRAFGEVMRAPRSGICTFENVVCKWAERNGYVSAVIHPGESEVISHEGHLESTPRQFHTTASLAGEFGTHLFSLGEPPRLLRRLRMMTRLLLRTGHIAARQLKDDAMYELAFKIVHAPLPSATQLQPGVNTIPPHRKAPPAG